MTTITPTSWLDLLEQTKIGSNPENQKYICKQKFGKNQTRFLVLTNLELREAKSQNNNCKKLSLDKIHSISIKLFDYIEKPDPADRSWKTYVIGALAVVTPLIGAISLFTRSPGLRYIFQALVAGQMTAIASKLSEDYRFEDKLKKSADKMFKEYEANFPKTEKPSISEVNTASENPKYTFGTKLQDLEQQEANFIRTLTIVSEMYLHANQKRVEKIKTNWDKFKYFFSFNNKTSSLSLQARINNVSGNNSIRSKVDLRVEKNVINVFDSKLSHTPENYQVALDGIKLLGCFSSGRIFVPPVKEALPYQGFQFVTGIYATDQNNLARAIFANSLKSVTKAA